jgi:mRNA interferase HigB
MIVVGKRKVVEFGRRYADAKSPLASWVLEAETASWKSPTDIKQRYPQASILRGTRIIFNIRWNRYRLVADVDYETQIVVIYWIGTHEEYDRLVF